MREIRTDLAAEAHALNAEKGVDDGIAVEEKTVNGARVSVAEIKAGEGEAKSGRKAGLYITLDTGKPWHKSRAERLSLAHTLKELLLPLLPDGNGAVLVAGLGNEAVTPDAIGPYTANALVVTHHMKRLNAPLYEGLGFSDVAAIVPGVLGQTGIESALLIKAAADCVKPRCVIAIDALASRSLERLGTTVQISNTGIAPGSGVGGGREELSLQTVGVPVIGIGVPTVVDARTVAIELTGEEAVDFEPFFVTPKEADTIVRVQSRLLSLALNLALHKDADDIDEYAPL